MFRKWIEIFHPVGLGAATVCILFASRYHVLDFARMHSLSLTQLYAAVFGWASVQTGSLLGVYGMIFSKGDGFVGRLRNTKTLAHFYDYIKESLWLGFTLTVSTIPFLVQNLDIKDLDSRSFELVSLWFSVFVWALLSFVRVIRIFNAIVAVKDLPERIPG